MNLRNLLLGAGLGLLTYSTPSFARESAIDKFKGLLERAKEKTSETKERARESYRRTKEKLKQTSPRQVLDTYDKIKLEATIIAVKNVRVYDIEDKEFKSFDQVMREMMEENPSAFRGSDFEKDPVRTALGLIYSPQRFKKYKVIDDGSGNWVSLEDAVHTINKQTRNLMEQTEETSFKKSRKYRYKPSLETIIDKEITLRSVNGWWEDLNENIHFEDKSIRVYTDASTQSATEGTAGLPIKLEILCDGEYYFSITSDRKMVNAHTHLPRRGAGYFVHTSEEDQVELTVTDYTLRRIRGVHGERTKDLAINDITFRIKAIQRNLPQDYQKPTPRSYSKKPPQRKKPKFLLKRKLPPTGLEPKIINYLNNNQGSRLLDISILLGSSDKARGTLSYLLEEDKIKIKNHKYYLTK